METEKLKTDWYHFLCLNIRNFRQLSMDEQGTLTLAMFETHREILENYPEFNTLSEMEQKIIVIEKTETLC